MFNIDNYLNRILYSNHQLHPSLKSQQNHIKKPGKYALHTYLELKSSPLSKLGYTIFLISSQIGPRQIGPKSKRLQNESQIDHIFQIE